MFVHYTIFSVNPITFLCSMYTYIHLYIHDNYTYEYMNVLYIHRLCL